MGLGYYSLASWLMAGLSLLFLAAGICGLRTIGGRAGRLMLIGGILCSVWVLRYFVSIFGYYLAHADIGFGRVWFSLILYLCPIVGAVVFLMGVFLMLGQVGRMRERSEQLEAVLAARDAANQRSDG